MMMLSPIILVLVFGSIFLSHAVEPPVAARPLMAVGATAMVLVSMIQFVGNQFGFDRGGFRVYVLSAAPRRDILLGKNLAAAPLALGMSMVLVSVLQVLCPMRFDYLAAALPEVVVMYLLFCVVANWMSIYSPMGIRRGRFGPPTRKGLRCCSSWRSPSCSCRRSVRRCCRWALNWCWLSWGGSRVPRFV